MTRPIRAARRIRSNERLRYDRDWTTRDAFARTVPYRADDPTGEQRIDEETSSADESPSGHHCAVASEKHARYFAPATRRHRPTPPTLRLVHEYDIATIYRFSQLFLSPFSFSTCSLYPFSLGSSIGILPSIVSIEPSFEFKPSNVLCDRATMARTTMYNVIDQRPLVLCLLFSFH